MRKSIAIAAIILLAVSGAFAQLSLTEFQSSLEGFADDMANTLAVNSTIGANWSDAYIGKLPHFGAGLAVGAAFASADSAKTLFAKMGGSLPSELESLGVPIPSAVATAKIGIPFLPIDIGLKGGYIPESVGKAINASSGMTVDYKNFGVQVRYAIIKQNIALPNVSVGAAYNYQEGSISAPLNASSVPSYTVGAYTITATDPTASLKWTSNTFDFTAQVSKQLLFFIPYLGAGLTVGKSSVTGGVNADVATNYPGGVGGLKSYIEGQGLPVPDQLDATGLTYTKAATAPVFRIYGGFSLRILLDLDVQAMYVPATKALGASATLRFQL
jgi:hypothetical protein